MSPSKTYNIFKICITGAAVTWAPGWLSVLARWESLLPGSAEPLVTMTVYGILTSAFPSSVRGVRRLSSNLRGPRARRLFVVFCWLPCCWALRFSSDNISSFRLLTACKMSSSGCLFRVLEHWLTGSGLMLSWLSRMSTYDTSEG